MQQIFLLGIVLLTLILIFLQRYQQIKKDAAVSTADLTFWEWLEHSAIEIVFNIVFFIALCMGINIDSLIHATQTVTENARQADQVSILGAIATGTAIYKGVQFTVLPLFNWISGAKTARAKLRNKVAEVAEVSKA